MIKKLVVIGVFVIIYGRIWGQNLVPNGGFEGYSGCPDGAGQIDSASFWVNPQQTISGSDYFNQCANPGVVGVPTNFPGYQNAHSGVGYSGLICYYNGAASYREYIEIALITPLTTGMCYHFEAYINLANISRYTTYNVGVYFSDTIIVAITGMTVFPFIPQINNSPGNYPDSLNWTLVSGDLIASGGENYLIIGNYADDINTSAIIVNSNGAAHAYIYIDDVSLTPCATGINIPDFKNLEYLIYPNPAEDWITVSGLQFPLKTEIKIYDMMGKEILKSQIVNPKSQINISMLKQGMYFIEINGERKKFVKQNP